MKNLLLTFVLGISYLSPAFSEALVEYECGDGKCYFVVSGKCDDYEWGPSVTDCTDLQFAPPVGGSGSTGVVLNVYDDDYCTTEKTVYMDENYNVILEYINGSDLYSYTIGNVGQYEVEDLTNATSFSFNFSCTDSDNTITTNNPTDLSFLLNSSDSEFKTNTTTSINDKKSISLPMLTISPKPATDHIFINTSGFETNTQLTYSIYSINGSLIIESQKISVSDNAKQNRIEISMLPKGTYLMKINSTENDFYTTQKFIVQ